MALVQHYVRLQIRVISLFFSFYSKYRSCYFVSNKYGDWCFGSSSGKRHVALGILGVTQGLSAAIGPVLGGVITQNLGWRWVFLVNLPICAIAIVLCFIMLIIKNEERVVAKIDWTGLVLSSLAIFFSHLF